MILMHIIIRSYIEMLIHVIDYDSVSYRLDSKGIILMHIIIRSYTEMLIHVYVINLSHISLCCVTH